ncbi:methyltransferase domain-containing protein [Roseibacillus persicicus]|uniref:Methyltransferase domain-containing protein n=1 Tax=Roseibacillus persicicus TaxID=454148 RepID=A0A918TMC1_9BACT|nr:class I SAM-dependent methyltransferase [Roseibacillus persicicus]GHC54412.1 hypothetical protein GCM10007100_21030 [Roseibacillus persicicus]
MSTDSLEKKLSSGVISFLTSRGQRVKARVRDLRADSLAFELLSAENILQMSEVLREVEIKVGERLAYQGELTVTGIVPLGVMVVCDARLSGNWLLDSFATDDFLANIEENLENHTVEWARDHEIRPVFRAMVGDLETYLTGLETWCEQVECGGLANRSDREAREEQILTRVGPIVSREIASHFADYERVVKKLDADLRVAHRAHLMKTVHRFILQSPFSYRCFKKPLGYAGDYGMVNLMLGNPYQGATLFAKLLNNAFLETGPVTAHQNRIHYLVDTLREVATERAAKGLRTRVLNLGCGPAQEIRRFIEEEAVSEMCDFELLDFSAETLRHTKREIGESQERSGRHINFSLIQESIQGFLRQASRGEEYDKNSYDLVYCAGLFDYLQQRFCAKLTSVLTELIKQDGLVVVTNVSKHNTIPSVMEDFLDWSIIERTEEEMLALAPTENLSILKELKSDVTRINLFLELRKPAALRSDVDAPEKTDAATNGRSSLSGTVRSGGSHLAGSEL